MKMSPSRLGGVSRIFHSEGQNMEKMGSPIPQIYAAAGEARSTNTRGKL